uniref:Phosphodiesterase 4D interacting protein n=1 Tax=Crocodylus porosus TaxID=8502 RepID=A0A7M4FSS6_CROPO
ILTEPGHSRGPESRTYLLKSLGKVCNIELKVEVESLKRELQEKQQVLDKTWVAAESLTNRNEAELRRQYEEKQQESEHVYELLENKVQLLQEETRLAKSEAEKTAALAEVEKERCQELTEKLKEVSRKEEEARKAQVLLDDYCAALAQKNKMIEELTQNLSAKEQLIELLSTEKQNLLQRLEEPKEMEVQVRCQLDHQQLTQCEPAATEHVSRLHVVELQDRIQQFDATNKLLQEKLNELNFELKSVRETSRKQDRTIQSLNETLKSKDCETEELYHVIEGQNETMAKLRDMLHRSQLGHLQISENPSPAQQQQVALLELQNTLFCTQLEVQKGKRAQRQKEHQLAEARRALQLLETAVQEEQQQQEAAWKHNQELRGFVQKLQAELKDKGQQLQNLEWEKCRETQAHKQRLQRLSQSLAHKEQLLQESRELRHHHQSLDKSPTVANAMLEKLQQRVKDRDAALERAVDDKFCALEEKEQELRQLHLSIREQERDLERLRSILSSNEATIHSLESLLKAKTLELEQASATCQNLQWLKEEVEAKSSSRQKEQEGIIQQLQTSLHDRNKEVEELTATLLCKLGPGQSEIIEELCVRLQRKERMLQDLLNDRSRQVVEHESEIRGLLQAISTKEERSRVSYAWSSDPVQMAMEWPRTGRQVCVKGVSFLRPTADSTVSSLQLELSALQSVVATQEEELQVQVSDVESLTRKIQIKEDLIKDLQMQLVDPEEIPAMDRLTQEVLMLREKVSITESRGQEAAGNRRQQLLLMLEGLVAERNRLNEALQAERQLYSSLVKFHTHPDSSERNHTLQVELEGVQALRDRLEEALGRSLERLSRLETQGAIGGQHMGEDTEDTSTEFTDSIEEEAPTRSTAAQVSLRENKLEVKDIQSNSLAPALLESLQMELLWERSQSQQIKEEKRKVEGELRELKAQLEEAGFSSVSHIRKAMLSLCLENAELKEQVGEATSSVECGEREEEKAEASLQSSFWTRLGESGSGQSAQQRLSQPAQGRQHYQELQDKLAVSEATVRAQAEQLEQYWTLLNEPLVQQDSKQVQVDLQDLGYETCGRSETEADREETTSPECEEPDVFSEASLTEELSAQCKLLASAVSCSPLGAPLKSQLQTLGSDQLQDIAVLQQHIQDLRAQLQNANKVIQSLQRRARSFSATSDYASGADRPHKLKPGCVPDGSPARSATDEDEGWQSDGFSAFCPPALQASRDLERLVQRVSLLEAQLPKAKPGGMLPQELRSTVWPGKYDSLIQAQARELSHLRQKLREGRGVSHTLTQHLKDTTKSFEELLRGTDIDYYMGQSFREHLAQGSQLAERLSSKLSSSTLDKSGHELLAIRLSKELQEKKKMIETLEAKLQECSESASSSRAASESPRSDSSASFLSDGLEACSDMDAASEDTQYQEEERNEQPSHCHSGNTSAQASVPGQMRLMGSAQSQTGSTGKGCPAQPSVTLTVPPVKAASLTSTFNEASPSSSSHCLRAAHMAPPQPHPLQSLTQPHRKVEASFVDSGALWDLPHLSQPQKGTFYGELSSGSSGYPSSQKLTGADLLEEHLAEIRSLRQRLEESICTNDRLREQLENRIASTTKSNGSPTNIYIQGLEPTSQLSSENRALREDNKSLQLQLDHLSRELERLRETLLTTHSRLQDAQAEQEQQQAEQQRLVEEVQEKQQSALQLREEQLALQEKNNRLQRTVTLLQQQCEENRLVFQALRSELRVYDTLFGPSKVAMSGMCPPSGSDLDALLAEVQALRSQLLQGIQVNSSLRQQLEQQQEGRASLVTHGSTSHVFAANKPPGDWQLFQGPALISELCKEDPSARKGSPSLKGDDPTGSFASKHGCHIIGHVDDYSTLKQQILEGKMLVHKMASLMRPALSVPSLEAQGMERGSIRQLFGSTSTLHQILEECASLLSLFWRAALPAASSPVMKEEILELRAQLLKKETLLQSMAERLQSTSRLKENMEHFIISHLTKTHDVLKKARTNLEVS